jgi:hypothetical protein
VENPLGYSLRSLLLTGEEPCLLILANGFLNHPESFIKIADAVFKKNNILFYHRHFLPSGRADFTASALLQRIRSEEPQLHPLRLYLRQHRLVNNSGKLT